MYFRISKNRKYMFVIVVKYKNEKKLKVLRFLFWWSIQIKFRYTSDIC